jgi:two-component system, NtrC family, sensor kinase
MNLLDIGIQSRVIIGISAMVVLFSSFLIAFVAYQRKQLQYHKDLRLMHEEQKKTLLEQNIKLEERVSERTLELSQQKENLQIALTELKSSQMRLVQSEKMASLGEVMAGIAHEIQNPLNFMNNFSEVNTELIDELKSELKSGNAGEAISILNDIQENEQKINHHGRRADSIIKGMLQHSRSSSGANEPANINVLADEYLRISYRGMRIKNNSFNPVIRKDFDETIGNVSIVPQDVGRVLLNLFNNAFYAVSEKKKHNVENYEPSISLSTKKIKNNIEIRVWDNGNGISRGVIDKIFQPFFTTKPAGQGTGLGLSLSYDIIKAHGGEIKVETKEGEFTEFLVQIPVV